MTVVYLTLLTISRYSSSGIAEDITASFMAMDKVRHARRPAMFRSAFTPPREMA
ncbi:MAG: hypothetical protein IKI40_04750 [Treponema sp.]|nr:hypothetical protein [Treponema sp.]